MPGRRRALLVAVDSYDEDRLPGLVTPLRDAEALAEVLADPSLGAFEVEILRNETYWTVVERVEEILATSRKGDDVLLHFGGHGLKDDGGGLYLAARNTRSQRLVSTGVDSAAVLRMMRASLAASVILLLDCCFGGAFARGTLARTADGLDLGARVDEGMAGGRGLAVLTASSATEWAFEKDGTSRRGTPTASVFTSALVEGIRSGDADRDEDGRISLHELYEYVAERVRRQSPQQNPNKWEFGVRESLFIARSPRRSVAAGELPDGIKRLLAESDPPTRALAIPRLVELAQGEDLPVAVAARRRLEILADDDSRRASEAAEQSLTLVRLRVSPTRVDLGLIRPGTGAAPVTVQLGDLPLAQLSRVRADPGIRAWIDGGRLLVTAGYTGPGLLAGTVTLTGPAGTATVEVTGWSLPDPVELLDRAYGLTRTTVGTPLGELAMLVGLAFVAERAGDPDRAARMLAPVPDLLRAITDRTDRAAASAGYAWMLVRSGDRTGARARVEQARTFLPAPAPAVRKALEAPTRAPGARGVEAVTRRAKRESEDQFPVLAALVVEWVGTAAGLPGAVTRLVARARAVLDALVTDDMGHALGLVGMASVLAATGHAEEGRGLLAEADAETAELDGSETVLVRLAAVWATSRTAGPEQAARLIDEVTGLATGLPTDERGIALAALGWLAGQLGEHDRSLSCLENALAVARDPGTSYDDRLLIGLATGWAAAQLGHHDLGTEAAAVVDEEVPEHHDAEERAVALVVAALVAAMADRADLHDLRLRAAAESAGTLTGDNAAPAVEAALTWVRALIGPGTSADFIATAAALLLGLDETAEPSAETADPYLITRLLLPLLSAWSLPAGSPADAFPGGTAGLLADAEAELADSELDASVFYETAAAWVAVQVGDRERALRLLNGVIALTAEQDAEDEPLWAAAFLAVLAWICAAGDRRPHPLVLGLLQVLLPTERRTDRTAAFFGVLSELCFLLVPADPAP